MTTLRWVSATLYTLERKGRGERRRNPKKEGEKLNVQTEI